MTTTVQAIYVRALRCHERNDDLLIAPSEILARVGADQQALFATLAAGTRDRFQTTATLTSTSGSNARSVDLTALATPLERIIQVTLPGGTEVNQVDVLDTAAEFAPRYYVQALSLYEVSNDWSASGVGVALTIRYVTGPTTIASLSTSSFTQLVTVPDEWADLLVLPLAMGFHEQDATARDSAAYDRLAARLTERQDAFAKYLQGYGGIESRRFDIPRPTGFKK